METNEVYEIIDGDERSASTTSMYGATIVSSAAGSSAQPSRDVNSGGGDGDGRIHVPIGESLSLSINPSMIDSSVLIRSGTIPDDGNDNWIGQHRSGLSQSSFSITSSDISTIDSESTSSHVTPYIFANIERSLILASAGSSSETTSSSSTDSTASETECVSEAAAEASTLEKYTGKKVKWWDQLQTDEDWENFRAKANDYLNALVDQELKTIISDEQDNSNADGFSRLRQWLQGLYDALIVSNRNSSNVSYLTPFVKEVAEIKRQLDLLPPEPPSLPEGLELDALPSDSRDMITQYQTQLEAWRAEAMPQYTELKKKYILCQENLLAAIINAEEEMFYERKGGGYGNRDDLGAVNEDNGYVEVVGKNSPKWDGINEEIIASQSRCQLAIPAASRAAIVAVLTAGVAWGTHFLLALQSKRR